MKTLILLIAAPFYIFAQPQVDTTHTGRAWNCRGWRQVTDSMHLGYAVGLKDGYGFSPGEKKSSSTEFPSMLELGPSTYGEVSDAISSFCEKPENANIPVLYGAIIFCMKARGETPRAIEEYGAAIRRFHSTAPPK